MSRPPTPRRHVRPSPLRLCCHPCPNRAPSPLYPRACFLSFIRSRVTTTTSVRLRFTRMTRQQRQVHTTHRQVYTTHRQVHTTHQAHRRGLVTVTPRRRASLPLPTSPDIRLLIAHRTQTMKVMAAEMNLKAMWMTKKLQDVPLYHQRRKRNRRIL
jgi:hypothetical protein